LSLKREHTENFRLWAKQEEDGNRSGGEYGGASSGASEDDSNEHHGNIPIEGRQLPAATIEIPADYDSGRYSVAVSRTRIRAHGDIASNDYDSGLTVPSLTAAVPGDGDPRRSQNIQPGDQIEVYCQLGSDPGLRGDRKVTAKLNII